MRGASAARWARPGPRAARSRPVASPSRHGARPPARRRPRQRTALAATLTVGVVGSLLLGWYWAGAADARARAATARARPAAELRVHAERVAAELRRDLEEVLRRESQRPYYHYSNLFRDPRATSAGLALAPSPLASGPSEPLVAEHFQIDSGGAVTLPTINDDEPALSSRARLADHVSARTRLAATQGRLRARVLDAGARVALAEPGPASAPQRRPAVAQAVAPAPDGLGNQRGQVDEPPTRNTIERLDPEIYAQNAAPTQVYQNIVGRKNNQQAPPVPTPSARALAGLEQGQVTIVSSALAWYAVELDGQPELVAMRQVSTPDGELVQGLVIERRALERWLTERDDERDESPGHVALVAQRDGAARADWVTVVAPWALAATPPASALAAAAASAASIERGFYWRFAGGALAAAVAGAFLIGLIAGAERLARERSQFAAAAAHELRTPLAGLQLYGDMLADGLGDPSKARDYARRLSEEAARLGRVVANVLGFSQLERGSLALSLEVGDLSAVLRELVARAEPALERQGAFLELVVPASLPARFDRDAVLRIVGNLLDNAEKYGRGAADRTITLSALAVPGRDAVEVVVSDRGPGVPPELGRRLFRPFSRALGGDHPAGLGLGLALSRSLAEAMGGSLEYHRLTRSGQEQTDFVLRLPAS